MDYIECVVSMASRKDGGGKSRSFGWSTGWLPGGKGAVGAKKVLVVVVKEGGDGEQDGGEGGSTMVVGAWQR